MGRIKKKTVFESPTKTVEIRKNIGEVLVKQFT